MLYHADQKWVAHSGLLCGVDYVCLLPNWTRKTHTACNVGKNIPGCTNKMHGFRERPFSRASHAHLLCVEVVYHSLEALQTKHTDLGRDITKEPAMQASTYFAEVVYNSLQAS